MKSIYTLLNELNKEMNDLVVTHTSSLNKLTEPGTYDLTKFSQDLFKSIATSKTFICSEEFRNLAIEKLAGKSIEEFSKENILQGDVEALALADDCFVKHCASLVSVDFDSIDTHIKPDKYAYHLAYSNPELATQLLDELLYYRNLGRI